MIGFKQTFAAMFKEKSRTTWLSLGIVGIAWLAVSLFAVHLLRIGYKIRN